MNQILRLCVVLLITIASARAGEGRLPGGVKPLRYDIWLQPEVEQQTFAGKVQIELELAKPQSELVLNSLGLTITAATADGAKLAATTDDAAQLLTLKGAELAAGRHTVKLEFSGKLNERPEGLYLTRYQLADGTVRKALVTQMEPADARRMFPCWDEPEYRAAFQLTAVAPVKDTVLFNMPIESEKVLEGGTKKEVRFGSTPPMASYLVAMVSAELEGIEDEVHGIKLRVLSVPGRREQMRYAMEVTKQVLVYYHDYFGVRYPLPKLDQVSFPSVSAGGMENWGCIIYSDFALLFDEKQSGQESRERVFSVVAHEIAHQWFGDLVTMQWWDDLWLNEGFASWMATKASDHFNPTWKKWERAAGSKETAMRLDARATTHPVQQPVRSAGEAMQAFDEITYQKGQAFLRMLESWLGEDKFRAGLRRYFSRHANGNTVTADLWHALGEESGEDVASVASGWTEQPGFPMVIVRDVGAGRIELAQERFTIHQKDPKPLSWQVPLFLSFPGTQAVPRTVLLGGMTERMAGAIPVLVNTGNAGYYRVRYEGEAWASLKAVLTSLPEVERLSMLNDTWASVQAERVPLTAWLELADRLRDDPSPLVAAEMVSVLGTLDRLMQGRPEAGKFQAWARGFLAPQWRRYEWDARPPEEAATASLRSDLIELLGELGEAGIRMEAHARLGKFLQNPSSLPGDLRAAVLHVAGLDADAALWEQIHALALKTVDTEQKSLLYGGLAAVQAADLVSKTLNTALTGELPAKTAARMVGRVAAEGRQIELAWKFASEHREALLALCSAGEASSYLAKVARNFSEGARADELEALTRAKLPPEAMRDTAIAADEIRFKAGFKERALPELLKWMEARGSGSGR